MAKAFLSCIRVYLRCSETYNDINKEYDINGNIFDNERIILGNYTI